MTMIPVSLSCLLVADLVPLDQPFRARIRLPYGDELGWRFGGGELFELKVGSQRIGQGRVR